MSEMRDGVKRKWENIRVSKMQDKNNLDEMPELRTDVASKNRREVRKHGVQEMQRDIDIISREALLENCAR